jgi:lipopolysaccharide/colanic/teichoic acid biosynthesis glycosyltransferase
MTTLELSFPKVKQAPQGIKRGIDFILAVILLFLAAPLVAFMALLVRQDTPGPSFYWQWRIGIGGRPFRLLKLRSMVDGAEDGLEACLNGDPARRPDWEAFQKLRHDPRLTKVGAFLRRWSIDELPQLWNVLRGEMSLVGPRPMLPSQQIIYGPQIDLYVQVRPGMTGLWQVNGRNQTSFAERADWDAQYIRNWRPRLDVEILIRTVGVILRGDGAF